MSRLADLTARIEAARQPPPPAAAILGLRDVLDAFRIHPIARQLPIGFDVDRLRADLARIDEAWWSGHQGPYHDGAWEMVSLWAPRGDLFEQRSFGGEFAATPALEQCPYFREVMDAFPCPKNRVRLMRLRSGGRIHRHADPMHQISRELVRIHVPIVTSAEVNFLVHDRRIVMEAGTAWLVDVRFPHEVHNLGPLARVHLVLDLLLNPPLRELLRRSRAAGHGFLTGYYLAHSLPIRMRQRMGIGN